jgi:hypothetical protein
MIKNSKSFCSDGVTRHLAHKLAEHSTKVTIFGDKKN